MHLIIMHYLIRIIRWPVTGLWHRGKKYKRMGIPGATVPLFSSRSWMVSQHLLQPFQLVEKSQDAEIDRLFADSIKWSDLTPAKPKDKTWCVLLPGSLGCSQWILHQIKVQSGLKKPARNDLSTEMFWPTLHLKAQKHTLLQRIFRQTNAAQRKG